MLRQSTVAPPARLVPGGIEYEHGFRTCADGRESVATSLFEERSDPGVHAGRDREVAMPEKPHDPLQFVQTPRSAAQVVHPLRQFVLDGRRARPNTAFRQASKTSRLHSMYDSAAGAWSSSSRVSVRCTTPPATDSTLPRSFRKGAMRGSLSATWSRRSVRRAARRRATVPRKSR